LARLQSLTLRTTITPRLVRLTLSVAATVVNGQIRPQARKVRTAFTVVVPHHSETAAAPGGYQLTGQPPPGCCCDST
jgi:hypothetical protein